MVSDLDFEKLLVKTSEFMVLENLALKTRKNYLYNISKFLVWIRDNSLFIGSVPVKRYFLFLLGKYDVNTVRQIRASLLYFFKVNKFDVDIDLLPSPKRKKLLPKVLSKQEIISMIELCGNIKHKLLISLLYSSGLRVSEIVNLHRKDINPYDCTIFVHQSKGRKDRYTIFAHSIKPLLTDYLCETTFKTPYLFEGRKGKYSVKTIQEILKKASSKINKHVTPHMLRHSFATHLLESGTDIKYIKELLGHSKLETTNIYVRVAKTNFLKVKNPLD